MEKLELKDNWSMRRTGEENWREARVWGSVYTDLLRNGEIPDPYWKDNEDQICALMEADYEYQCRFTAEDPESYARVFLSFEGLDTVADIWLNGTYLGHAENMHRTWDYEVKEYLKKDNVLQVIFRSPLKFIARAYEKYKNIGNDDTYEGFMHLRKAHYMFGWDWGAHLPDAGIFRPVYLCYVKNASLENVYIRQRQEKDDWMLEFEIRKKEEKKGDYQIQVSALSPPGKSFRDLAFSGWDRHSQDPGSPAVVGQWSGRSAFISDPGGALSERRTGRLLGEEDRSSENDGEKGKRSVGGKLCP